MLERHLVLGALHRIGPLATLERRLCPLWELKMEVVKGEHGMW